MHNERKLDSLESYIDDQTLNAWLERIARQETNIPEEKICELYAIAYHLYQRQQYRQATDFFRTLTMLRPLENRYWRALGSSLHMQKEYDQALQYYICSQLISEETADPYLYVHVADCYFALNQNEQGLQALDNAYLIAKEQKNERVVNHVTLMNKLWSNKKNKPV